MSRCYSRAVAFSPTRETTSSVNVRFLCSSARPKAAMSDQASTTALCQAWRRPQLLGALRAESVIDFVHVLWHPL